MTNNKCTKPSTVIFDFDGTLFNLNVDWKSVKKNLAKLYEESGYSGTFTPLSEHLKAAHSHTFEKMGFKKAEKLKIKANELVKKFEMSGASSGQIVKGSKELLSMLHEKSIRIGIVSSNLTKTVNYVVKRHEWKINCIIGSDQITNHKPSPEGVNKCLDMLSNSSSNVWGVGDREIDIEAYKRANISTTYKIDETNNLIKLCKKISKI